MSVIGWARISFRKKFVAERLESGTDNWYAEAICDRRASIWLDKVPHSHGGQPTSKAATLLGIQPSSRLRASKLKSLAIESSDLRFK